LIEDIAAGPLIFTIMNDLVQVVLALVALLTPPLAVVCWLLRELLQIHRSLLKQLVDDVGALKEKGCPYFTQNTAKDSDT
jgi:hypothetical protein